jgi:hypothetical protein
MMRQSPKPCNQVQGEANPISSPVSEVWAPVPRQSSGLSSWYLIFITNCDNF